MLKVDDPTAGPVLKLADAWLQREMMSSDGPKAAMSKIIKTILDEHQNVSDDKGEMSPSEWTAMLCTMPERVVEAVLLSPWIWHEEQIVEAIEARDRVPRDVAEHVWWHGEVPEDWDGEWLWWRREKD